MLLIYCQDITPRLRYTLKVIFKSTVDAEYEVTDDLVAFSVHSGPKLVYGKESVANTPFIWQEGLLHEAELRPAQPEKGSDFNGLATLFATNDKSALLPFDIFSAAFYIITRYEEYLPHERDNHDRFIPTNSINYKYGFLNKAIVNRWGIALAQAIQTTHPEFTWKKPTFDFISTIDVDNAFAYAHKGFLRAVGGLAQDVLDFKFARMGDRIKSWATDLNDPYNTYPIIEGIAQQYKHKLQWFFLIGDYGYNDKNPYWLNSPFQRLIKYISGKYVTGVHPSYASYRHVEKVLEERQRMEQITGRYTSTARCHFLRLKFPDTYRGLRYCEILDDYTMAHSPLPGFRAGICTPYKWYDVLRDEETPLTLHPSIIMEGTLRDYMKLCPAEGSSAIAELMDEVKTVGGQFISIWHNDSFTRENKEWIDVYEGMVKMGQEAKAA